MPIFWKRSKSVEQMLEDYQQALDDAVKTFSETIHEYLSNGRTQKFEEGVREVHRCESHVDDLRREIEMTLYGRQLLPESRGDLLGILEAVDRIPNALETILFILHDESVEIPTFIQQSLRDLVDINISAYHLVRKALYALFNNPAETLYVCKEIDQKESESDHLERAIIRQVYGSELPLARKMQLKEVILHVGSISDRGENCADRIGIIAIKRNI